MASAVYEGRASAPRSSSGAASAVEDKDALQRVVPAEVEVVAECLMLGAVLQCLADKDRRTRNGREYRVAEGCCRSVGSLVRLELGKADCTNFQGSAPFMDIEGDRYAFDRDYLADQLRE